MATFNGTAGNDNLIGTAAADLFKLFQGGNDTASGKAGNDDFRLGATLTAADSINGGADNDVLLLEGDYSAGLTFGATTMVKVETLRVKGAFAYELTLDDGNVGAGDSLNVDATSLAAGFGLTFNGAAETDGHFAFTGSASNDRLLGGGNADTFSITLGGNDTANGGGGKDTFLAGNALGTDDHVIGGGAVDILRIDGVGLVDLLVFNALTVTEVEKLIVTSDAYVAIQTHDATVAAGKTMQIDGSAVLTHNFSIGGHLETDGHFKITGGGDEGDVLGGALSDTLKMSAHTGQYLILGGGGADDIRCNTGEDYLFYQNAGQSTSSGRDVVHNFDASEDLFDFDVVLAGFTANGPDVSISEATFDADLGTAIDDGIIGDSGYIVHASGGDLVGHDFLVIDTNNDTQYDAGVDYVIDITGFSGTLTAANFV